MLSLEFVGFRSRVNASVMQAEVTVGVDRLLTIKEAAARLWASTATVYALCERGGLPYVRLSTHAIRIAERDLAEFIRLHRCGSR
jgi:excisionase family DNA binding protein